jgi:hypothetical protein
LKNFLSPAEQSFYRVLRVVSSDRLIICPKVALGDLFFAKTGEHRQNRIHLNRIDRKHADFVLCDAKTLHPVAAIELDDKSHDREDRQDRDKFVEGVFANAKLPLQRVKARQGYSSAELHSLIEPFMGSAPIESANPVTVADPQPSQLPKVESPGNPKCPKCGTEMVLRTARTGSNQGNKFWGCTNFPRCRAVLEYRA